jgi:hypothetical protein
MHNVNELEVKVGGEWITATLMFSAARKAAGLIKSDRFAKRTLIKEKQARPFKRGNWKVAR